MIITMAAISAYDEDEVHLSIETEIGECIKVGDIISIPMNNHSYEQREIKAMFRDWVKWEKGKDSIMEIKDGEWAECIINGIHSGKIHTISAPYDDEIFEGMPVECGVGTAVIGKTNQLLR